jgi:hypothetical protein
VDSDIVIQRPQPRGVNKRGLPTWSGAEVKWFREALGVPQGHAAQAAGEWQAAVSTVFENLRSPVAVEYRKMVQYIDAIEKVAAERKVSQAKAVEKLAEMRKTLPDLDGQFNTKPIGGWRTPAEAQRIRDEQRVEGGHTS